MTIAYLDCFSGISGNMMVGALLDAGMPLEYLEAELKKLALSSYKLIDKEVSKNGIRARYFNVDVNKWFQPARNFNDIRLIIEDSLLSDQVKKHSLAIFSRLAAAEAKVHGVAVDKIHFHEVGAIDSIVDIVGTAIGLEYLGIVEIYASALHVGSGYVKCSHGLMPVPAPATAELLTGIPFYAEGIKKELVTPTGAAIVAALAKGFGSPPAHFITRKVCYGSGSRDIDIPNVLRLYLGDKELRNNLGAAGETKIIETNIDDLNPQVYGYVMERLFAAGAHEVYLTSILMKKNRPGTKITVMAAAGKVSDIVQILLAETSTLGVRILGCETTHIDVSMLNIETEWGTVKVKVGKLNDKVMNIAPEFEDCKTIAVKHKIPLKTIHLQVLRSCGPMLDLMLK
ncbi:nickel pincer cofactor biosynthesis protein LarC [Sporomusa termitida]|uniref:Pyridinium-3,5-bisthiocarboxylic acid mononucleotide nickel insertion protein n=1 Tax=Sporomusa termitida TaxID=2377 RepID=A0A517DY42_9FIRM|nr:nickel pincer cofactor biosynthesis protein LarC [Sporomusa termitida]QDR82280.1 Pyridinium-3,5-bisthiocarboxylic acid mononucleotide nickel insertion protein [Sporomusa termitida]